MTDVFEGGQDVLADEFYEAERRQGEIARAIVQLLKEADGDMVAALRKALVYNQARGYMTAFGSLLIQQVDGQGGGPAEIIGA